MKFELNLTNAHRMQETIKALKNASEDGYKLSAYEKTLLLDAHFIFLEMFKQTNLGKRIDAIEKHRDLYKKANHE